MYTSGAQAMRAYAIPACEGALATHATGHSAPGPPRGHAHGPDGEPEEHRRRVNCHSLNSPKGLATLRVAPAEVPLERGDRDGDPADQAPRGLLPGCPHHTAYPLEASARVPSLPEHHRPRSEGGEVPSKSSAPLATASRVTGVRRASKWPRSCAMTVRIRSVCLAEASPAAPRRLASPESAAF